MSGFDGLFLALAVILYSNAPKKWPFLALVPIISFGKAFFPYYETSYLGFWAIPIILLFNKESLPAIIILFSNFPNLTQTITLGFLLLILVYIINFQFGVFIARQKAFKYFFVGVIYHLFIPLMYL